jgi:exonuclease SbcC
MKLIRLEMENIRSYDKRKIEFPEGRILFEGDIGSGKSTILMAIEFALFGLGNEKSESLLRIGSTKGKVVLEFATNEHHVIITRILEKKKKVISQTGCKIEIDDLEHDLSVTELKAKVLKLLKFNEPINPKAKSIIYRYVIFTPQEEMKTILWISPQERLNTLRKAMQLEDYKTAGIHGKNLSIRLDAIVHNRDRILSDLNQKESERKTYEITINTKMEEIDNCKKEKIKFETSVKNLNIELIKAQTEKERLMLIENKAISKKQLLEKEKEAIKQFERELGQLQKNIQIYTKEINENLNKIGKLATIKPPSQRTIQEIETDLNSLRKLEKDRNIITTSRNQYTESLKKLEEELKDDAQLSLDILNLKIE